MLIKALKERVYLGDGLYAQHDGWQIWLMCERDNGENAVALEPEVLQAFDSYRMKINQLVEEIKELEL
jgi:hypothetical protein